MPELNWEGDHSGPPPALTPLHPPSTSLELNSSASAAQTMLNADEVSALMAERGFPELERLWNDFSASGQNVEDLKQEQLNRDRRAHMQPLFGYPRTLVGLAYLAGTAATMPLRPGIDQASSNLPDSIKPIMPQMYSLNCAVLFTAAFVGIQRYLVHPLKRIMARETANMLRWPNFRKSLEEADSWKRAGELLQKAGINQTWDDPNYRKVYRISENSVSEVGEESTAQRIQRCLREVLGHKDQESRKFVPGRLTPALNKGKGSVSQIVAKYGSELAQARNSELTPAHAVTVLEDIRDNFIKPDSEALRFLNAEISILKGERQALPEGAVRADIWARDPWVDLTHQKEFFSSASLRGRSIFESGSKGRLGPFCYIYNRCISCLDLSTSKGRVVRTRMLAASTKNSKSEAVQILFVDGVEGTNSVRPEIIKHAVEDYAKRCGFDAVAYNASVHNQTPRLFVEHLGKLGVTKCEFHMRATDSNTREYLDAFGIPIQPMEYAKPVGKVIAHIVPLNEKAEEIGGPPSLGGMFHRFLKHKLLYILYADAAFFGALSASSVSNALAVCMLAGSAVGLVLNEWYKGRSGRKR